MKGFVRNTPDWDLRSAIALEPGRWLMRNGHRAEVVRSQNFPATKNGKPVPFVVWFGRCLDCNAGVSWNANGTYAAHGKHALDIVKRA